MTSLSPASPSSSFPRLVLADRIFPRSLATDAILVVAGVALTAVLAQVAIPLWPVPITGQTLAVLLVGSTLGAARGAISMALYAALGMIGLPIFSDGSHGVGVVFGPTGGYIIGFIVSAALVGWLSERSWDRKLLKAAVTFLAGTVVTFAIGLPWLAATLGLNLEQTLQGGLYPFIIGGLVKTAIATGLLPLAWLGADRFSSKR